MSLHLPHNRQRRAVGAYAVLTLLMATLGIAFFRIQVLRSTTWELRAESNRIRQLSVPTPRGVIFDRNGEILADNVPGYAITIPPGPLDSVRATLRRLSEYIDLPASEIERVVGTMARFGREVVVDADAPFEVVSAIEERRAEFPGVYIEMRPRRRYLIGEAASHVLGYVGEITATELESDDFSDDRYAQGMVVGKTGIEKQYEGVLQGRPGLKYVEFDARGRIVGDFAGVRTDAGEAGHNLTLNLDLELQEFIHSIFPDTLAGAVVALDPADGGVLALYSAPTFDPNAFVGGIDAELWNALMTDEQKPLYDRSVLGLYPPASTWKLAAAGIALDLGVVTPDEYMPIQCTGSFTWGNRTWRCWDPAGHGRQTLAEAIGNSCDVYFYQLGLRVGLDAMLQRATDIGFSRRCGIDLPQESQGDFPAERAWWERRFNYKPTEGEVLNLAIGQGPNSQTPLKVAQFYLAIARNGSAPAPAIAKGVTPGEGWSLNLAPEHIEAMREGLRMVTAPGGTAHYPTALEHWEVIGKSGTGQNSLSLQGLAANHAWFAGMAGPPGGDPEIVVAVIVEYGVGGSSMAAPIMAKTADYYLRRKHGIPVDTVQTYLDHVRARRPMPWYRLRFPPPPAPATGGEGQSPGQSPAPAPAPTPEPMPAQAPAQPTQTPGQGL
ncbi:MAG: penicillin-binding protein 2 [Gemmatimonadales bacterium]